jgi:peptide/nickel transport system substrate-binding protein
MQFRALKLRFRRRIRRSQHQVEDLSQQAEAQLEQHLFKRIGRLVPIWRFITGWTLLWLLLIVIVVVQLEGLGNYFQTLQPAPGGTYTEGIVGTFSNANPLYATSNVDLTVSNLIFPGLMKYNSDNQLVGSLAQSLSVSPDGMLYTVHLKPDLKWQDGQPLTSADVVYTYHTIQDPDAQSPLNTSWQDVVVSTPNPLTVTFQLPNPLSSFPYSLTNGIVPEHILGKIDPVDLRSSLFNISHPIGSGPFEWQTIQVNNTTPATTETQIELVPYADYYGGKPKLDSFVVDAFASEGAMTNSFNKHELTSMANPTSLPANLANNDSIHQYSLILTAAQMVFFNTSQALLQSTPVRQALVDAANPDAIIAKLSYATLPVKEPLLIGQLGYNTSYEQTTDQLAAGEALLAKAGWATGAGGIRFKGGQPLTFNLFSLQDSEDNLVSAMLKQQWQQLGVKVNIVSQNPSDFGDTVTERGYDALLYGISIGIDPDVFVYWDSSQSHSIGGQNYSLYNSPTADTSLEAGRTRLDPALRAIKYEGFLQSWQQDAPALGLYQPRFWYVSWDNIYGLNERQINTDTDRFNNVQNWEIREAKVTDR